MLAWRPVLWCDTSLYRFREKVHDMVWVSAVVNWGSKLWDWEQGQMAFNWPVLTWASTSNNGENLGVSILPGPALLSRAESLVSTIACLPFEQYIWKNPVMTTRCDFISGALRGFGLRSLSFQNLVLTSCQGQLSLQIFATSMFSQWFHDIALSVS